MGDAMFEGETQWLSQVAAMREAIASLQLPPLQDATQMYGADLQLDDDSNDSLDDDIWEVSSEFDESPPSAHDGIEINGIKTPDDTTGTRYDKSWLRQQCTNLAKMRSGIEAEDLSQQITALLASDLSDDELQMALAEVIGFDELDLVIELIAHRQEVPSDHTATVRQTDGLFNVTLTREQRETALRQQDYDHKHAALAPAHDRKGPQYPHVYISDSAAAGNMLDVSGKRYTLPAGSTRKDHPRFEEYAIPATRVGSLAAGQRLIQINEMDGLCQTTFKGYKSLNRMQSLVYPVAYGTSENMLICAPTGAGKTDAAMLAILHAISKNILPNPLDEPDATEFMVHSNDFKIVYVAPMKALAAEITAKYSKRLAWLGVQVREYTGDMQLTKKEIAATQIIVTTPEKWDVVTRKSTGDTELVQKVRLLVLDECHLLHDDRGAVLESLVARTERQVESTQAVIRIVGLSATLPNYVDVADFLKVNRMTGLFYFDGSFRPVPLEQHFIGVKGKVGTKVQRENLDLTTFEKVRELLREEKQVMVFVHSRKDTVGTARMLWQHAIDDQCTDLFLPNLGTPAAESALRDLKNTRGRELRDIVPKGFACHNAGMARTDRNYVERIFGEGAVKVLCCTATLAWGVNLPAAAVIIKGTQIYSASVGKFVDLGILDVLQIFGRAGRPQFQDSGIGYICTTQDKLQHYLGAVTSQQPIESKFSQHLVDNLNAEISLGTVTSVAEGVAWLGYSYLFVRMRRNPSNYGIDWDEFSDDPQLGQRRRKLIVDAARTLHRSQMIIFNENTDELKAKDVGRIASQYYVRQTSIEVFNTMMRPQATEADVLKMISMSSEFDNIQSRENESQELQRLKESSAPCQVEDRKSEQDFVGGKEGKVIENHAKTNILLQSYISRAHMEDFALVSDTSYVAQNAARICRALFMVALNRGWGYQCLVLLSMCKAIEKRIWAFQHPFHQFDLPLPILRNLDDKAPSSNIESLREMDAAEIGNLVHNQKMGSTISRLLDNFPTLAIEAEIAPLNRDVLRMRLLIYPEFTWNDRHHGTSESYWIWVENSETSEIYHHEFFILSRRKLHDDHELNFTIPLADPIPTQIYVRAVSDRWLGAETVHPVSFQHLIRPDTQSVYTDLLDLQPLPVSVLKDPRLEELYGQKFKFFNPMQTQIFHTLYNTSNNVLLGSPTGSGKTIAAELAMWWAFREKPGSKVVYIAPMKALVRERVQDWRKRLAIPMGLKLVELTGDNTPDTRTIRDADIIITTPEKWDGISRSWQTRGYVRQVSLVCIDEIHLLAGDRGPILEIIVSRMNYIARENAHGGIRLLGMSTACANAADLANWLGVKGNNQGLFNFRHSVRPVPLEIYIDGFPEQRGFCPLMQSMNRPTFLAIKSHSPDKPVIVFVASRRQTRLTAKDLINYCGMEDDPRRFLHFSSEEDLQLTLSAVKDSALREALSFGIGLHHAGLVESDRTLAEQLFAANKIQILVATSTLAWGVNLPAHLVVVKGTQYFDAKIEGYKDMDLTDVLQMLGRAGRPQFDTSGIARIFTQDAKKAFYKHFLHTGFPVESSLHKVLDNHLSAEISAGVITTKQDALDYLTWTFFFRRLHKNPTYYGLELSAEEHKDNPLAAKQIAADYMIELVDKALGDLAESDCVEIFSNGDIDPTPFGKTVSYYYLSHLTVRMFLQKARNTTSIQFGDVLAWVSLATEFDELPVRHNEDLINAELAKNLPLGTEGLMDNLPMWDPHVKAFLLLQAFMSRVELPISDYVGDQTSVLDQSIRIIQAAVDVMTELGNLNAVQQMIRLLQCIKSARWPEDYPLSILPGVSELSDDKLKDKVPTDLTTLVAVADRHGGKTIEGLMNLLGLQTQDRKPFGQAVSALPNIALTVNSPEPGSLLVAFSRQNLVQSNEVRIYAPRFPKPQTEGYFVVVRDGSDILALKRATWPASPNGRSVRNSQRKSNVKVKLEGSDQERKVTVLLISDAYPGMQWTVDGVVMPVKRIETVEVDVDESLIKGKGKSAANG